jgi:hypothetical protein
MPGQSRSKNGVALLAYVPGIHAEPVMHRMKYSRSGAAWMAGTSPAMTEADFIERMSLVLRSLSSA